MSKTPNYVGIQDGRLSPAFAAEPNNITTYEAGAYPKEAPLQYSGGIVEAKADLIAVVNAMPGTQLITDDGDYLHFAFRSRLLRFVDDVEFLFDDENKQIHFRSASRSGYSDLNVNQTRMAEIRAAFER
ncbi:MAG: DUF1499 domain-containing protein [Candidatus Promineifilaceae bacterium]